MPKSSKRPQGRTKRPESSAKAPVKPTVKAVEADTIWNRFRRNPMAIIGLVVVLSMVLGLAVSFAGPPSAAPTPTPAYAAGAPTRQSEVTALSTATSKPAGATPVARKTYTSVPAMAIDVNKSYVATITTDKGAMVFNLLPKVAPITVNAFVALSRDGFYNGLTFHRVENWVIQGGDPKGDGTGGPGYNLPAEFSSSISQITGTLAMARSSDPNSAGSQFYVTLSDASWLNGQYTAFGQVVSGMDVALKTAKGDVIRSISIEEK